LARWWSGSSGSRSSRGLGPLSRFVLLFLLAYSLALIIWIQLLPLYAQVVAAVAQRLLPVLEHPRLTTALEAVGAGEGTAAIDGIAVYSQPLKSQGTLYTIHARNVFGNAPALAALLLTLPHLAGRRVRSLLRGTVYLFLAHVLFVQVKLYHLYAVEAPDVRDLVYTDLFRFLIRGAHIFFLTVGSEAFVGFAAVIAVIATYLAEERPAGAASESRLASRRRFLPADVGATVGVLLALTLIGTLLPRETARIFAERVETAASPTPTALTLAGYERLEMGDRAGARRAFTRVLEADPAHAVAHKELADLALAEQEWERAALHLRKVVQGNPADAAALANLGAVEIRLDDALAAEEHLAGSLELDPALVPPRLTLARLLRALGRDGEAVELLRAAPRASPDARVDALLGEFLEKRDEPCPALDHYRRALSVAAGLSAAEQLQLQQRLPELERRCPDAPAP
jgi:tetratricopeptide (TPR) repeat protein